MPQQMMLRNPLNLREFINQVANRFEAQKGMLVTALAREKLIQPALPHQDEVNQELNAGNITIEFLEDSVFSILDLAREIALSIGQDHIGENTTQESMRRDCPYVFWC